MLHEGQPLILQVESPDPSEPAAGCELPDPSCLTLLCSPFQVSWAPPSEQKSMTQWSSRLRTWPPARTTSTPLGCPTGRRQRVSWAITRCCKSLHSTSTLLPACQEGARPSLTMLFMSLYEDIRSQRSLSLRKQEDHAQPRNKLR